MTQIFQDEGYAIIDNVVPPAQLEALDGGLSVASGAGSRTLLEQDWCRELAWHLKTHPRIAPLLPADAVVVQCTLFEKSPQSNWLVALHQDLSVPVRERVDHPALGGWSEKEGECFVQPPADALADIVAVRLSIDPCGADNGPVRVVPGSHRKGRLAQADMLALRDAHGERDCIVQPGGVLAMRPLLLHASSKARLPNRRRVLHFLCAPATPPCGLSWRYAV